MSDSRDDILREQIGDLGGEQPTPDHGLGVLQHIPGQRMSKLVSMRLKLRLQRRDK